MSSEYIRARQELIQPDRFLNADLSILEKFSNKTISLKKVLAQLKSKVPEHLLTTSGVDAITIGTFPFLSKISATSVFQDGGIYISSKVPSEQDLREALIHEYAHAIEKTNEDVLYGGGSVEQEFLGKRERLKERIAAAGFFVKRYNFSATVEDNKLFDLFFSKIGYDKMVSMTKDLFISAYSATSLSEYFSTCFTTYFFVHGKYKTLSELSPAVFNKLQILSLRPTDTLAEGEEE